MNLQRRKEVDDDEHRKHGITVEDVDRLNTGDHWHVAASVEAAPIRPIRADDKLVAKAIREVTNGFPSLHLEQQQPTPEEYLVGHLWCVRVPGSADNLEELVTKCLRSLMGTRLKHC